MRQGWISTILFLSVCFSLGAHDNGLLKTGDITPIMQQIFSEHVDKKQMTDKILQSSLDIYIDQFDPNRIYLLKSEIAPFTHLSPEQLRQAMKQYKTNDFSLFKQLDQVFQRAIERSRQWRPEIELEAKNHHFHFGSNKTTHQPLSKEPQGQSFAETPDELKQRLLQHLIAYIETQKERYGPALIIQKKDRVLLSFENQLHTSENHYLYQDDKGQPLSTAERENLFTIRVLKALASSLDSHTAFYETHEAYNLRVRLQKEFKGIGLVLKDAREGIVITHLFENGPAARNGSIKVGDLLVEVDHQSVKDQPFEKVMEKLHGEKESTIKLTFKRPGAEGAVPDIYTVDLKRELVTLNNERVDVSSEPFGQGIIGKMTLHSFYQGDDLSSEKDLREAIQKLKHQGHLRGLILDLRSNGGGFISQAIKVAGLFITNGVVVISKYGNGEEQVYRDIDNRITYDGPLIVLTSKATASAAEIVAQALQDYGVALIVGDEHTYGKGTIQAQTITDNPNGSYFKVTVGKYYTVSGHTPQKQGVKADIVVPSHWSREQIGESYIDSVEPDTIPSSYNDSLKDIPVELLPWYIKYYLPTVQHRTTEWREWLPLLRKNSEYRLSHNKNYQLYLKGELEDKEDDDDDEWSATDEKNKTSGEDDLQMQEAVNILKDMIMFHRLESKKS